MDSKSGVSLISASKINVLCLTAYYLPGYKSGGPVRSISALVSHLNDEVNFNIFTCDRDINDSESYSNINVGNWNRINGNNIFYTSNSLASIRDLIKVMNQGTYDLIYFNSFFSFKFSIFPLIIYKLIINKSINILLAPRGEFSEGAFKLKKTKKNLFVFFAKLFGIYKNIFWHASSIYESDDINNIWGQSINKSRVLIASDLTNFIFEKSTLNLNQKFQMAPFKICFISRISPKKNLSFALSILSKVQGDIIFDIYGPIEDEKYWDECNSMIRKMPSHIQISYNGVISHEDVNSIFGQYNLFLFPTLGENFGHVIIESLVAGTPVLISNNTPWRNLNSSGIGWDLDLSDQIGFVNAIQSILSMNMHEYLLVRKKAKDFGLARISDFSKIEENIKLFQFAALK